jgi:uncharacterized membrane protein
MNKIFLDKARLKTLTDSVLIVGIVLLVYNLATLAGSDPDKFESELFSNTLVAYINAFVIVFMYWSLLSVILDITLYLDDTLFLLFLILLITLTLLPVANILFLQSSSQGAANFVAFTHIAPGLLLILVMKFKRDRLHQLSATESRYILVCLTIIPSLSSISFAFYYYNTFVSNAIALLVIPAFIVVGRILHKNT